jgi:hypothetical protein
VGGSWGGIRLPSFKPTHGILNGYYVQKKKGGRGERMYVCTLAMRKRENDDASRLTIALDSCVNPCQAYGARLWDNR